MSLTKWKRKLLRAGIYLLFLFFTVNLLLAAVLVITVIMLADSLKTIGAFKIITPHEKLGHFYKPLAQTYDVYPDSSKILSICTDQNGFRISCQTDEDNRKNYNHKFLYLGDSFTFGQFCEEDSTYPALLSGRFNADCRNAGVQGCGFAHMLLLAEQIIPAEKPDVVFFQYSDWLFSRVKHISNPDVPFVSSPYIAEAHDNFVLIQQPVYCNRRVLNLFNEIYSSHEFSIFDWVAFTLKITVAIINREFQLIRVQLRLLTGNIPPPPRLLIIKSC